MPLAPVLSSNPSDSHSSTSGHRLSASLITQMNGLPDDSSPRPISITCRGCVRTRLPKLTKRTDPGSIPSSHLDTSSSSTEDAFPLAALLAASLLQRDSGPTGRTAFPVASA
ncbi:UDP-glycosyltransferase 73C5-like [Iris pallida]|uniref:UDP-glycosyltransferase 73C5-like n=1 Tax=Iris pallida TaxID=29817 RepID=A0AAX6E2F1_IRIPA|nr:UDP-glycosyltransferase 73C5-like [Iris pallida]